MCKGTSFELDFIGTLTLIELNPSSDYRLSEEGTEIAEKIVKMFDFIFGDSIGSHRKLLLNFPTPFFLN